MRLHVKKFLGVVLVYGSFLILSSNTRNVVCAAAAPTTSRGKSDHESTASSSARHLNAVPSCADGNSDACPQPTCPPEEAAGMLVTGSITVVADLPSSCSDENVGCLDVRNALTDGLCGVLAAWNDGVVCSHDENRNFSTRFAVKSNYAQVVITFSILACAPSASVAEIRANHISGAVQELFAQGDSFRESLVSGINGRYEGQELVSSLKEYNHRWTVACSPASLCENEQIVEEEDSATTRSEGSSNAVLLLGLLFSLLGTRLVCQR